MFPCRGSDEDFHLLDLASVGALACCGGLSADAIRADAADMSWSEKDTIIVRAIVHKQTVDVEIEVI